MSIPTNRRILLVDDMPAIHKDFHKILMPAALAQDEFDATEAALFGEQAKAAAVTFQLDSAYQGQEALVKVQASVQANLPYALAFVDMRMPPGWNGVQTIEHLWKADPRLQIVICTAYSDTAWDEVLERLDARDRLLILKKPFDAIEVYQLARSLSAKWQMARDAALRVNLLEKAVEQRTAELRTANELLQQDLLQRTRDEAELKLAASVFHYTLDGIMIIDPKRLIVSVNPAFQGLTGYSAEELVGQPVSILRSQRQGPDFYLEMWNALERAGRWEGELWSQRRDGDDFLGHVNIAMVPDSAGRHSRYVSVFHDVTELRRKEERIRHQAFHDTLTDLPNRTLLLDRLEQAVLAARRDREPLGLMYIDLDRFKAINDSFGHAAGDCLLKEMARRLGNCLRKSDTVARLGGDEFVALVRRVEIPPNYGLVAQKIIASLSAPVSLADNEVQVGVSIGIACFPDDAQESEELMKHADAAMYAAKAAGRGTYRFFRPAMTEHD